MQRENLVAHLTFQREEREFVSLFSLYLRSLSFLFYRMNWHDREKNDTKHIIALSTMGMGCDCLHGQTTVNSHGPLHLPLAHERSVILTWPRRVKHNSLFFAMFISIDNSCDSHIMRAHCHISIRSIKHNSLFNHSICIVFTIMIKFK